MKTFIILIFVILAIILFAYVFPQIKQAIFVQEPLNPFVSSNAILQTTRIISPLPKQSAPPQNHYQEIFDKYQQKYPDIDISVDLIDLKNNEQYQLNPDNINIGASTTKLFTASAFLSELEKGKYTFKDPLGSFNTKFQLEQMINQSNNNSWQLFYSLLTIQKIESYTHSIGSKNFKISDNTLKASDMTNYLKKLYKNQLHSEGNTNYLLSLMKETNEDSFLPDLPPSYIVYHKNGQLEQVVNEAILAIGKDKTLAIAIYTDGKDKWEYENRSNLFKELVQEILEK